ncbi:YibE/F family protein, partial [Phocaeicola dorei]|uniref:YibE/F family protein n=1 Tax=Phocaeicola dorei TaxID=357276 RepID=UPI00293F44ED
MIVNTILFMLAIELDLRMQAAHVLLIFGVLALIFTVVSLVMILGFTRRMLATLGATVFGTLAAMLISLLVFNLTQERGIY